MAFKSTRELAQSLSEEERQQLLDKISLSLEKQRQENQESSPKDNFQKEVVDEEMRMSTVVKGLGFFQQLLFFIREVFSSKTRQELVLDIQMKKLIDNICEQNDSLFRPETGLLSIGFVRLLRKLHADSRAFQQFCSKIWSEPKFLQGALDYILEKKIPNAKVGILQFIDAKGLQENFEEHENIRTLKALIIKKIDAYIKNIPVEIFQEIERGIIPIYYYRPIMSFDFDALFSAFPEHAGTKSGMATYYTTKADYISAELEELYKSLLVTQNKQAAVCPHDEFFSYLLSLSDHLEGEKGVEKWKKAFKDLNKAIAQFLKQSQLQNIIRYIKKNPYYTERKNIPELNISEFYHYSLQLKVLGELGVEFSSIRKAMVHKKREELFPPTMATFDYYRRFTSTVREALPVFLYVNSLLDLYQFLVYSFTQVHVPMLKNIGRLFIVRDRDLYSSLVVHIATTEELLETIRHFDKSFSPLSNEGKDFHSLRARAERDVTQLKLYQIFVAGKNKEALEYLNQGKNQLAILKDILVQMQEMGAHAGARHESSDFDDVETTMHSIIRDLNSTQKIIFYDQQLEDEGVY